MRNRGLLFLSLLLCCTGLVQAQSWELQDSLKIGEVRAFAEDLTGKIYLGTAAGAVWQLSAAAEVTGRYVPGLPSPVRAIDASKGTQVLVHYGDLQQYALLDRFMAEASEEPNWVPQSEGIVNLLCPASDGMLWLVNQSRYSLMKYDVFSRMVLQERFLGGVDQDTIANRFVAMMEYKGRLLLATQNEGLWVFDLTGAYLGKREIAGDWQAMGLEQVVSRREGRFFVQPLFEGEAQPVFLPAKAGKPDGIWMQGRLLLCWHHGYLYRFHKKG